jgi:hypothetical protein
MVHTRAEGQKDGISTSHAVFSGKMSKGKRKKSSQIQILGVAMPNIAMPNFITEPVLLIRIARLYRDDFTDDELYDATRKCWKLGPRRNRVRYAFAVYKGEVKEVYEIDEWHPGGTTPCKSTVHNNLGGEAGRWEFTGKQAQEPIRSKYVGKSVAAYFKQGMAAPVLYVNV